MTSDLGRHKEHVLGFPAEERSGPIVSCDQYDNERRLGQVVQPGAYSLPVQCPSAAGPACHIVREPPAVLASQPTEYRVRELPRRPSKGIHAPN